MTLRAEAAAMAQIRGDLARRLVSLLQLQEGAREARFEWHFVVLVLLAERGAPLSAFSGVNLQGQIAQHRHFAPPVSNELAVLLVPLARESSPLVNTATDTMPSVPLGMPSKLQLGIFWRGKQCAS